MKDVLVVIGAGFAGMWSALAAARHLHQLKQDMVEIVLIAPSPELHIRPRLYEANPQQMKASLLPIFEQTGVQFKQGKVTAIDTEKKSLEVYQSGEVIQQPYTQLVLAAGSQLFKPSIPGLDEYAFNIDQLETASKLEQHLYELADQPTTAARNTLVITGAGFTGIELAAELPARAQEILGENARVILLDKAQEVGPELGAGPRPIIKEALASQEVELKLGVTITSIAADHIQLSNGEKIETNTLIWTAGARASDLTQLIPGDRDEFGRLYVDEYLNVIGCDSVIASGDCARAEVDAQGHLAMMSCQHAMNLGRSAGHNAAALLIAQQQMPYSQPKYVTCLDLGPWGAVYTEGWDRQVHLQGAEAKELKTKINQEWIYPPEGSLKEIFELADPARIVVA